MSKSQNRPMSRTDMLVGINDIKRRMGREINTTDLPPELRMALARVFGSPEKALELAQAPVTQEQLAAWRTQFADEVERFVLWNVGRTIGMPDHLILKEAGAASSIDPRIMPDLRQKEELRDMVKKEKFGRNFKSLLE